MTDNINEFASNSPDFMGLVDQKEEELKAKAPQEEDAEEIEELEESEEEEGEEEIEDEQEDDIAEDDEEDSEEDEDSEEEDEDDKEDDKDEDKEKPTKKAKKYNITMPDGTQVKATDDATIKLKVDGKFQRVKLADLASSYNGAIKYDELIRRESENNKKLESQVQHIEEENQKVKELTKNFVEGLTKGDLVQAMSIVAEMTDQPDVEKLINQAVDGMIAAVREYSQLSQAEIEKRARDFKLSQELREKERKLSKLEHDEKTKEIIRQKEELKEAYELEEELMKDAYEALELKNKQLQEQGEQLIEYTMNDIAVLAREFRVYDNIKGIVEELDLDLDNDELNHLVNIAILEENRKGKANGKQASPLKQKEYLKLVEKYLDKDINKLSRKVQKVKPTETNPKRKKNKSKKKGKVLKDINEAWGIS